MRQILLGSRQWIIFYVYQRMQINQHSSHEHMQRRCAKFAKTFIGWSFPLKNLINQRNLLPSCLSGLLITTFTGIRLQCKFPHTTRERVVVHSTCFFVLNHLHLMCVHSYTFSSDLYVHAVMAVWLCCINNCRWYSEAGLFIALFEPAI